MPIPYDYDGDGHADLAEYRLSTGEWFIRRSNPPPYPYNDPFRTLSFGSPSDGDAVRAY